MGDATSGQVIIDAMNLAGYDAMALGPYELALGQEVLRQRLGEAQFPILSANVLDSTSGELFVEPYVILEVDGHRIGIVGLTRLPEEPESGFEVLDPQQAAARLVPEVAAESDTVIILTNMGYRPALALANDLGDVDLIVAALPLQLPTSAARAGSGTLVVTADQAMPRHTGRRVGRLAVLVDEDGNLGGEIWESKPMDQSFVDDPAMTEMLDKYAP